jgi:segregation and condensation protein A
MIQEPPKDQDDTSVESIDSSSGEQEDILLDDEDYIDSMRAVVMGEVMDQVPKDLFIPPDALQVVLETFEGPLDLLLYLIRKQNLDIANIPVAEITKQYMGYVELMRRANLDLAAEYLVMAAMLAEIKSRILLPKLRLIEEDEEDPRLALVRQLQQYERFREAANDLEDRPRVDRDVFIASAQRDDPNPPKTQPKVTLQQLTRAFQDVLERAHVNQLHQITRETMSMRERMTDILKSLNDSGSDYLRIEDLFTQKEGRMGLVVTFIALLELLKDDMLTLVQNEAFSPIHIKRAA